MNILGLTTEIRFLLDNSKREFNSGNDFQAEQNLVKLRLLLNEQPELEGGGSLVDRQHKNRQKNNTDLKDHKI